MALECGGTVTIRCSLVNRQCQASMYERIIGNSTTFKSRYFLCITFSLYLVKSMYESLHRQFRCRTGGRPFYRYVMLFRYSAIPLFRYSAIPYSVFSRLPVNRWSEFTYREQYTGEQYTGEQYTGEQYTGEQHTGEQYAGGPLYDGHWLGT